MIISHSRKFIFIKTFKTGGSSLEIALSKYCGKDDILTELDPPEEALRRERYGIGAQNFERPLRSYGALALWRRATRGTLRRRFGEHQSAYRVRESVGEDIWNSYFTFTVVRHPFDRCVSRYFYSREREPHVPRESRWHTDRIGEFLRYNPDRIVENWKLYTECDEVIVDFVARYEHLEADLAHVSERIGLPENLADEMAQIRAKGGMRPESATAETMLNDRHRALISLLCAKEMELFGYDRERKPGAALRAG